MATLDELNEDALVRILKEPKNALVKQYQKLLELDNVALKFTDDALVAVSKEALKRKSGAGGCGPSGAGHAGPDVRTALLEGRAGLSHHRRLHHQTCRPILTYRSEEGVPG